MLFKLKLNSHEEITRLVIPRVLRAIYAIRNKKKVGHFKDIIPSKIDMKYVDNSVKFNSIALTSKSNSCSYSSTFNDLWRYAYEELLNC